MEVRGSSPCESTQNNERKQLMPKETIVIDTLTVSPNEILRIATLNILSNTSQLTERLEQLKKKLLNMILI